MPPQTTTTTTTMNGAVDGSPAPSRPSSAAASVLMHVSRRTQHAHKPYPKQFGVGGVDRDDDLVQFGAATGATDDGDSSEFVVLGADASVSSVATMEPASVSTDSALLGTQFTASADKLVNATSPQPPENVHHRLRTLGRFFDLLSAKSDIDHPLCQECGDLAVEALDQQLEMALLEKQLYEEAFAGGDLQPLGDAQLLDISKDVEQLRETEAKLMKNLRDVEEQRAAVRAETLRLERESKELDELEKSYWRELNSFEMESTRMRDDVDSAQRLLDDTNKRLDKLNRTNVYNDAFHIWHDGSFGTINGLRLGRLPSQPVEWHEINAAWGYVTLLLDILAKRLHYTFNTFRLLPMGSSSRIEKVGDDKAVYELYGSGDISLGRLFWNRRFDQGMCAFLACLQQLTDHLLTLDSTFKPHYSIVKDKIGDLSIKLQFNNDENWTKALKFMLTNLKIMTIAVGKLPTSPPLSSASAADAAVH